MNKVGSFCPLPWLPTIIENLKRLRDLQFQRYGFSPWAMRPRLGIAFVAMQRNIHDLPEVIKLGMQLGALEFSISNVLAHDDSLRSESLYLRSLDQVGGRANHRWKPLIHVPKMDISPATTQALAKLLKGDNALDFMGGELGMNGDQCPFVQRGSLSIRWDGKTSPCLPLLYTLTHYLDELERTSREYFVGDIRETELTAIWNHPDYLALRSRLQDFDFLPASIATVVKMPVKILKIALATCSRPAAAACGCRG